MALVSLDELIGYMSGVQLTPKQRMDAEASLIGVQQELENYLGRPVQPVRVREVVKARDGLVWPSITPVQKVIDLTPYLGSLIEYEVAENVRLTADDAERYYDSVFNDDFTLAVGNSIKVGSRSARYLINYVGGWNGYTNESIKMAIKRVAAREVIQHDDTLSFKDTSAKEPPNVGPRGWQKEELEAFDRMRRRVIAS